MLFITFAGASVIQFDSANSCYAANFGGTSCAATPGPTVYSSAASDVVILSPPPPSHNATELPFDTVSILPIRNTDQDCSSDEVLAGGPEGGASTVPDPVFGNRYGVFLLAYSTRPDDPNFPAPVAFPSTTLLLAIDSTEPSPGDCPEVSIAISLTSLIDNSGGIMSTNLEADALLPVKRDEDEKTIYSLVPDLISVPISRRY